MASDSAWETTVPEDNGGASKSDKSLRSLGLALAWDNDSQIRQRLRDGYNLLVHYDPKLRVQTNNDVQATLPNVKANHKVLAPVCKLFQHHGLPNIDRLEYDVKKLSTCYPKPMSSELASKQGWAIRQLIACLKGTVRKDKKDGSLKRYPKDRCFKHVLIQLLHTNCLKNLVESLRKPSLKPSLSSGGSGPSAAGSSREHGGPEEAGLLDKFYCQNQLGNNFTVLRKTGLLAYLLRTGAHFEK